MAWKGTVKGNVVVLDDDAHLPDGARVEIHLAAAARGADDPFAALLARRAANAGLRVNMDEIIEEEKQEREEYPHASLSPRTLGDAERQDCLMQRTLRTPYPLEHYLRCSTYIDFDHPLIREALLELRLRERSEIETVRAMFEYVRDAVAHSGDIQSPRVTRIASEVLRYSEGICYAKSHLLAALLRGVSIPAGICYQKLTRGATPETGYCIHALNTVYLASQKRWIRVDARGNKPGIDAQFSLNEEQLAFPVREQYGEIDYRINHPEPHPRIIETLESHEDCQVMYGTGRLPTDLCV